MIFHIIMHVCQKCGACCAVYRVSFYWGETLPDSFAVPAELTEPVNSLRAAMKGTSNIPPRCTALEGALGEYTNCTIYSNRPSPCRSFQASFENGVREERCDEARRLHGMKPLTPEDWK